MCDDADRQGLALITTEKDLARLAGDDETAQLAAHARALPVTLVIDEEDALKSLLLERLAAGRRQRTEDRGRRTEDGGQRTEDDSRER